MVAGMDISSQLKISCCLEKILNQARSLMRARMTPPQECVLMSVGQTLYRNTSKITYMSDNANWSRWSPYHNRPKHSSDAQDVLKAPTELLFSPVYISYSLPFLRYTTQILLNKYLNGGFLVIRVETEQMCSPFHQGPHGFLTQNLFIHVFYLLNHLICFFGEAETSANKSEKKVSYQEI